MTATVTYASTMAELRTEQPHSSLWPGYGSTMPMSGRYPNSMDPTMAAAAAAAAAHHGGPQHAGRPRSSQPSLDHSHPYARYSQEEADAYDRAQQQQHQQHLPPPLSSYGQHHNSLKRTFAQSEQQHQQPAYTEMVQDLRDDGARLTVGHDHKLLSFKKTPDKHTILDQHGRVQTLDLTAQLHGMFFLSEMPATSSDGTIMQPELTCYRRNLFQISGSLITPRGQLSIIAESGETVAVTSTEVTISAIESVDGHPVRLIVIPWKTPPPNSPETVQLPDQEPAPLPLIPFQDDGSSETEGEFAVYPIGWRRLQFRM